MAFALLEFKKQCETRKKCKRSEQYFVNKKGGQREEVTRKHLKRTYRVEAVGAER